MAPSNADLAHRAFSNLFVETEILPRHGAILCRRRRRTPEEEIPWMFHLLAVSRRALRGDTSYETDRARFIGRGRTAANPLAFDRPWTIAVVEHPGSGPRPYRSHPPHGDGTRRRFRNPAGGIRRGRDSRSRPGFDRKIRGPHFVERAFEMAWFQSQEVLRLLNVTEADAQIYGRLATSVIHANA
jgi:cyclic beta-1,2-glucan synthetase